jgi:hypothetical protein
MHQASSSLSSGLATRACGLPVASRAGPPLARGASGPPWQGVRPGVQRGVCEPAQHGGRNGRWKKLFDNHLEGSSIEHYSEVA